MTFFSQIYDKLAEGVPLKLTLLKNGDRLVVGVIPDVEDESLVPATMSGAPDEIDQAFFAALGGSISLTGIHLSDKMIKEAAKKKETTATTQKKPEEKKPDLFNADKPKEEPVKADQPKTAAPAPGTSKSVAPGPGTSKPMNVGKDITKEPEPEPEPVEDSGDASWDDPEESNDPDKSNGPKESAPVTEKPKTDVEPNQSEPSAIIDEDEDWEV